MAVKSRTRKRSKSARNRRAEMQEARRKRRQQQTLIYSLAGVVVVAILGFLAVRAIVTPSPGQAVPTMGNAHIQENAIGQMTYNTTPPTSGPHLGQLARWGVHTEPIPNEIQVHNLEDGGVLVQYNCPDGCDELVAQLTRIVKRYTDRVILAPYPDMDARIALTAWNRIDKFDEFDEERIVRFIKAYRGIDHHRG